MIIRYHSNLPGEGGEELPHPPIPPHPRNRIKSVPETRPKAPTGQYIHVVVSTYHKQAHVYLQHIRSDGQARSGTVVSLLWNQ